MRHATRVTAIALVQLLLSLIACATGAHAQEVFELYDKFNLPTLNPDKWYGNSLEGCCVTSTTGLSAPSLEFVRRVEDGALHLSLASYGADTAAAGAFSSRQGLALRVNGATPIKGLQAKVRVLNADVQACAANAGAAAQSRFYIMGFFFNDGTATGPTDTTGNIIGWLQIQKDADAGQRITGLVLRCTEATNCSTADVLGSVAFTATWDLNTPVVLRMVWQAAKDRFKFQLDPGLATEETQFVGYAVTDTAPPSGFDFKSVRLQNTNGNCDGARTFALMDVAVVNVSVLRQQ